MLLYTKHVYSVVCLCVCLYLIREGLALAIGELWLHEGVVVECCHVVVLSEKNSVQKHRRQICEESKGSASFLFSKIKYK